MARSDADVDGILVIDKPVGPTSHDVVSLVRRTLSTRAVGHAGTLDPAASGVLVVAIGQATKLVGHLTAHTKRYRATVRLGVSTSTLDAEGPIVARADLPPFLAEALARGETGLLESALEAERRRQEQTPPQFSAIKLQGTPAYQLARRGEHVVLSPRPVLVHELLVTAVNGDAFDLLLTVSKGYYVRSLARDLGEALGVPAHLASLRRVASGPFTEGESVSPHLAPAELHRAVLPLAHATRRTLETGELTPEGTQRALHGRTLGCEHFVKLPNSTVSAWFDPSGQLVALGRSSDGAHYLPMRVFRYSTSSSAR